MQIQSLSKELSATTYPGRGIVLGKSGGRPGCFYIAYFIMGRSENSRNRIFEIDGRGIRTKAFDESKMVDPSLIIYAPVRSAAMSPSSPTAIRPTRFMTRSKRGKPSKRRCAPHLRAGRPQFYPPHFQVWWSRRPIATACPSSNPPTAIPHPPGGISLIMTRPAPAKAISSTPTSRDGEPPALFRGRAGSRDHRRGSGDLFLDGMGQPERGQ